MHFSRDGDNKAENTTDPAQMSLDWEEPHALQKRGLEIKILGMN